MKNIMKKIALCVLLSKAVYCIETPECLKEKKIEKGILAVTAVGCAVATFTNIFEKIGIERGSNGFFKMLSLGAFGLIANMSLNK